MIHPNAHIAQHQFEWKATLGPKSHPQAPYRGVWSQSSEEPEKSKEKVISLASCKIFAEFGGFWIC